MVLTAEDLKREFKKLARSEQVGLLFDLWDEVGPTDEVFELTEAQREELELPLLDAIVYGVDICTILFIFEACLKACASSLALERASSSHLHRASIVPPSCLHRASIVPPSCLHRASIVPLSCLYRASIVPLAWPSSAPPA